jgi:hypothetical protein
MLGLRSRSCRTGPSSRGASQICGVSDFRCRDHTLRFLSGGLRLVRSRLLRTKSSCSLREGYGIRPRRSRPAGEQGQILRELQATTGVPAIPGPSPRMRTGKRVVARRQPALNSDNSVKVVWGKWQSKPATCTFPDAVYLTKSVVAFRNAFRLRNPFTLNVNATVDASQVVSQNRSGCVSAD